MLSKCPPYPQKGFYISREMQICLPYCLLLSPDILLIQLSESEVTESCLTLCNPMNCSLPGSSIHGIFQARVLEWVAISFSRGWRGLPFPSPGDLPNSGIEPRSPALQADALPSELPGKFYHSVRLNSNLKKTDMM